MKGWFQLSFFPCSICGQRERGKLASVYANWFDKDGDRSAWRQRYCVSCLTDLMATLKNGTSQGCDGMTCCPMCGKDASQDLSGIYLTIYPPRQPEREYALTTCGTCASTLQAHLQTAADRLGDRSVGAAAPTPSPNAAWSEVPW